MMEETSYIFVEKQNKTKKKQTKKLKDLMLLVPITLFPLISLQNSHVYQLKIFRHLTDTAFQIAYFLYFTAHTVACSIWDILHLNIVP